MWFKLIWFCLYYSQLVWDTNEALQWNAESSKLLKILKWKPQIFSEFPSPEIDGDFDNDFGLESLHLFGGDIVEDDDQHQDRNIIAKSEKLWPMGRIPYIISRKLSKEKSAIKTAMKHIENKTCIRFVQRTNENNYIRLYKGIGCNSRIGMYGGKQNVSLGAGCHKVGTIMHELVHAIGFYHEQSRSDRDKYIEIHWDNIQEGHEKNFVKLKPGQNLLLNEYDYDSITHYSEYSFSKDKVIGLKTMTAKKSGVELKSPKDKNLSAGDVRRINKIYNCKEDPSKQR